MKGIAQENSDHVAAITQNGFPEAPVNSPRGVDGRRERDAYDGAYRLLGLKFERRIAHLKAWREGIVDSHRAKQLRFQSEKLLVDEPLVRATPVKQKIGVRLMNLEPVRSREASTIGLVQDEPAYPRIVKPSLLEKGVVNGGFNNDMVIGIEMYDDARRGCRVVRHNPAINLVPNIHVDIEQHHPTPARVLSQSTWPAYLSTLSGETRAASSQEGRVGRRAFQCPQPAICRGNSERTDQGCPRARKAAYNVRAGGRHACTPVTGIGRGARVLSSGAKCEEILLARRFSSGFFFGSDGPGRAW